MKVDCPPAGVGCWEWLGARTSNGYGSFKAKGFSPQAHRVGFELLRGDIPSGMELDHLCHNRGCVNPFHLEPVSHAENVRRRSSTPVAVKTKAREPRKFARATHCGKGHEFTPDNTKVSKRGWRYCVTCSREYALRWHYEHRTPERLVEMAKKNRARRAHGKEG